MPYRIPEEINELVDGLKDIQRREYIQSREYSIKQVKASIQKKIDWFRNWNKRFNENLKEIDEILSKKY